jgi:hypothetical protein
MTFTKGFVPWNKGKKMSQGYIDKSREGLLKAYRSGKIKPWNKGLNAKDNLILKLVASKKVGKTRFDMLGDKNVAKRDEVRKKISLANKGCVGWNKGHTKYSDTRVLKHSLFMLNGGALGIHFGNNWAILLRLGGFS